MPRTRSGHNYTAKQIKRRRKAKQVMADPTTESTVLQALRVDFLCFLVFFVCFKSYFLQYSSEKSQSWQDCKQVIPHHSCRVKMFSKSNHIVFLCCLLPQFVGFFGFVVPNVFKQVFLHFLSERSEMLHRSSN